MLCSTAHGVSDTLPRLDVDARFIHSVNRDGAPWGAHPGLGAMDPKRRGQTAPVSGNSLPSGGGLEQKQGNEQASQHANKNISLNFIECLLFIRHYSSICMYSSAASHPEGKSDSELSRQINT